MRKQASIPDNLGTALGAFLHPYNTFKKLHATALSNSEFVVLALGIIIGQVGSLVLNVFLYGPDYASTYFVLALLIGPWLAWLLAYAFTWFAVNLFEPRDKRQFRGILVLYSYAYFPTSLLSAVFAVVGAWLLMLSKSPSVYLWFIIAGLVIQLIYYFAWTGAAVSVAKKNSWQRGVGISIGTTLLLTAIIVTILLIFIVPTYVMR
ncbi:hypothetical protein HYS54_02790 [Candidatus Micrarchaeota archaeon]|nr:hypothetical protein [Candidatus Micrarchaeota archaeon]